MYASASDEECGALLGIYSGARTGDADYTRALQGMAELDALAWAQHKPFVYVLVVDQSMPLPPAAWRKRFADANRSVKSARFLFAMVTESALMRGVYTAVTWLTGSPAGHSYTAVGSLQEAQRWLEIETGRDYPLHGMEHKARQSIRPQ